MEIADYPRRNGKILRNFEIFLPKFHFILPKFYFPPRWRIFICSLELSDFLPRGEGRGERGELVALVALVPLANSQQLTTVGGQRLVARGRGAARGGP